MKPTDRIRVTLITYAWIISGLSLLVFAQAFHQQKTFIDFLFALHLPFAPSTPIELDTISEIIITVVILILPGLYFQFWKVHQAAQWTIATMLLLGIVSIGLLYYAHIIFPLFYGLVALVTGTVTATTFSLIFSSQEQEFLRKAFSQFVSEDMLNELLRSPDKLSLQGKECLVTVMFIDIRNFTNYSEKHSAQLVVNRLNELLDIVTKIILSHQGTVDKYIGDSVMAFWGAPIADKKQVQHATRAALEIHKKIEQDTEFSVGIGINFGEAIVGNIGSSKRYDYTVIGDTVNTAARLESATKELKSPILIADAVLRRSQEEKNTFQTKSLGVFTLKGRNKPIRIHALLS